MPGRPCTPGAGAASDLACVPVDGHGHRFRRGVDQPDYVRLLRCFGSSGRAALPVTRGATSYGFNPQLVSSRLSHPSGPIRPATRGNSDHRNRHAIQSGDRCWRCQPRRKRRLPKGSSNVPEPERPPPPTPLSPLRSLTQGRQCLRFRLRYQGQSKRAQLGEGTRRPRGGRCPCGRQPGRSVDGEGREAGAQKDPAVALGRGTRAGAGRNPVREACEEQRQATSGRGGGSHPLGSATSLGAPFAARECRPAEHRLQAFHRHRHRSGARSTGPTSAASSPAPRPSAWRLPQGVRNSARSTCLSGSGGGRG